jgi:hypothetical protein
MSHASVTGSFGGALRSVWRWKSANSHGERRSACSAFASERHAAQLGPVMPAASSASRIEPG